MEFPQIYIDLYLIDTPGLESILGRSLRLTRALKLTLNYCAKMNGFTISVLDSIQTLSQLKIGSAVSADLSPDQPTLYI